MGGGRVEELYKFLAEHVFAPRRPASSSGSCVFLILSRCESK